MKTELSDEEIVRSAEECLGETQTENCGFRNLKDFALDIIGKHEAQRQAGQEPIGILAVLPGHGAVVGWYPGYTPKHNDLLYAAPQPNKDTAAIIEIDKVMLESGAHWPDVETDAMVVRHIKQFTRMLNAEQTEVQALRDQVRLAYMSGVDNFRRLYDAELFKVISVTGFQDLYAPAGSVPAPTTQGTQT